MFRPTALLVIVLAAIGGAARGQVLGIGPGSTAEGDYLRGVGVAAFGLGSYNLRTAMATSINVDAAIRLDAYISAALRAENIAKAEHRARVRAEREANWKAICERIRVNPEERDVLNGDSMNAVLQQILDLKVDDSSYRSAKVPLDGGTVRQVPFKIGEEGLAFSIRRLRARGKDRWPVALQDDRFASVRRAYEKAVDDALLEQIDGKVSTAALDRVDLAVEALSKRVEEDASLARDKVLMTQARANIREIKDAVKVFKSTVAEHVMGDLDKFAGVTVHELAKFMQAHKIRFAVARTPEERRLYVELYASLVRQRELIKEKSQDRDADR